MRRREGDEDRMEGGREGGRRMEEREVYRKKGGRGEKINGGGLKRAESFNTSALGGV